jgi:hypothetical protein
MDAVAICFAHENSLSFIPKESFCGKVRLNCRIKTIMNSQDLKIAAPKAATSTTSLKSGDRLNSTGAVASFLCAIHCALMPLLVTLLPLIGLGFLAAEPVEWGLVAMSAMLGASAICLGYREHRRRRPLAILGIGMALLVLGRLGEAYEWGEWGMPVLVFGGFTLVLAHIVNGRLCRACRTCASHDDACDRQNF